VISPKVYVPVLVAILAAIALFLLTGDKSFLITILLSLAAGGTGVAVKPAPEVTQEEVNQLSRRKRGLP
jgi:hypothetical protein